MHLLDFIFPKRCVGCGKLGRYFCSSCASIIRVIKPSEAICPVCERAAIGGATHPGCRTRYTIDGLTSFFHYDGPVRAAVKSIKYRLVTDLAAEFIFLIPHASLQLVMKQSSNGTIVPIPLHSSRFRYRGFNQAQVLGDRLAQRLNLPIRTDILLRAKKTVPQVEMKERDKRLKNMKDVFRLNPGSLTPASPAGRPGTVILFDDVFTTGATVRSAAMVLKHAGVRNVWGITMAR